VGKHYSHWPLAILLVCLILILQSCSETVEGPPPPPSPPVVNSTNVEPSPHNVLSVMVSGRTSNATEAAVEFGTNGDSLTQSTPFISVGGDSARVPVLGLRGSTTYSMRMVARSASGETARGTTLTFTTGDLPANILTPRIIASNSPTPGYVLVGIPRDTINGVPAYALIFDNEGQVVWYKVLDGASGSLPVVDFQLQYNNNYTIYGGLGGADAHFYETNRFGDVVDEYSATTSLSTGVHDVRTLSGGYTLYANDHRRMDLTGIIPGGLANQEVRGMTIEFHRPGTAPFNFSTFDHFSVTDADADIPLVNATSFINPWHSNAIEIDNDGNLLVSWRNMSIITKVNTQSGGIIWSMGSGSRNEFTFVNDPLNGCWKQHAIRRLPNGNVILFDNGNQHTPPQSRAVEYQLDETAKTATLVWEYRPSPPIFGAFTGNAQRLDNGNTFICFGAANRVQEVTPAGVVEWDAEFTMPGRVLYRAFKVGSLY
jgi:hypothetical protein